MDFEKKEFTIDGTRLILEDKIDTAHPWMSERILWIAGTGACYTVAPLCPARHDLLCFNYCADALKLKGPDFLKNALVLGCGGAAIPRWILEEYPNASVDVVDRSAEIISICKEYFMQRWVNSDRLRFHCVDAQYFEPPEYKYQFIFCDLFNGDNLATVVFEHDFAEKLRDMLSDDGFMMVNCGWYYNVDRVKEVYQSVFEDLKVLRREYWQTQVIRVSKGS